MKKQYKCAAKRKTQLNNFCTSIQAPTTGSAVFLLSCPTFIFCFRFFASLLFCSRFFICLLPFFVCPRTATTLLSFFMSTPVLRFLTILLLLSIFSLIFFYHTFIALKIFKQLLSNKLLHYLISSIEFFYLFLFFSLLLNKTNCKRTFNITFINFYLYSSNYIQKKIDSNFAECGFFAIIKLNQL